MDETPAPPDEPARRSSELDPYRGVLRLLVALAALGAIGAFGAAIAIPAPAALDAAVTLGLAAGVIGGAAKARALRRRRPHRAAEPLAVPRVEAEARPPDATPSVTSEQPVSTSEPPPTASTEPPAPAAPTTEAAVAGPVSPERTKAPERIAPPSPAEELDNTRTWVAGATITVIALEHVWLLGTAFRPGWVATGLVVAACLAAAGVAGLAARYLMSVEAAQLPESSSLGRGARVTAWVLVLVAIAATAAGFGLTAVFWVAHLLAATVIVGTCIGLFRKHIDRERPEFPLDLGVPAVLGARPNIIASMLDAARAPARDRSALDVGADRASAAASYRSRSASRRSAGYRRPSRSCVPTSGRSSNGSVSGSMGPRALARYPPALAVADRPRDADSGPARALADGRPRRPKSPARRTCCGPGEHAANEYTLLLGNGRDLITIDADGPVPHRRRARVGVRAAQNPADALRAIAYRAVMRATVEPHTRRGAVARTSRR